MIGHIAFITAKMKETERFFESMFGFMKGFSLHDNNGDPWIEYLVNKDGFFIELFYAKDHGAESPTDMALPGYSHFCIEVDDIGSVLQKAEELGVPFHKPLKVGSDGNKQCWFKDPNGLLIEVMEISPGSPQHRLRTRNAR